MWFIDTLKQWFDEDDEVFGLTKEDIHYTIHENDEDFHVCLSHI